MYFRNYLSDQEILTVACKTRRVNTEDKVYSYIREMIQQEIAQRDVAMNIDNAAERRAWFKELIEENTYYTADRCHVVSGCLTGMKAIVNDEFLKKNVQPEEVTAQNYSEKLDELLALTERMQFTDKQVKSLARRLSNSDVISCGGQAAISRLDALALQATAIYELAKEGRLSAFDTGASLTDVVNFVVADDSIRALQQACDRGQNAAIVGNFLMFALLSAVVVGSCILIPAATAMLVEVSIPLAIGTAVALLIALCAGVANETLDEAIEVTMDTGANIFADICVKAPAVVKNVVTPEAVYA